MRGMLATGQQYAVTWLTIHCGIREGGVRAIVSHRQHPAFTPCHAALIFMMQIRNLPFSQTPQEVAEAIYDAYMTKQNEVTVGLPFAMAANAFRLTGANVSALPFL